MLIARDAIDNNEFCQNTQLGLLYNDQDETQDFSDVTFAIIWFGLGLPSSLL